MSYTIGIDVGGTKIAGGLVSPGGQIVARTRRPSPSSDPHALVTEIASAVGDLAAEAGDARVEAVGVGAAGFTATDRSTVIFAPNLPWRDEPLGARVAEASGLRTVVENDANVAAWGEFRFGAAADASSSVTVTLGTGVGGGIVVDDRLLRGSRGFGGEIGHLTVKAQGRLCGCGLNGCWERYGSGSALVLEAREMASVAPDRCARLIELAHGDPWGITGHHVTQAATEGDEAALSLFEIVGKWNGLGIADLVAVLDPEVVVLAGGVAEAGELIRGPVERSMRANLTAKGHRPAPPVVLATLGGDAAILGAADLARV